VRLEMRVRWDANLLEPCMQALSDAEFAAGLDRLGPFEQRPLLAVAVSGGADSLALALLTRAWAKRRRGRVVALTVDHRLRAESTAEARQVGRWLRRRGIAHEILTWDGPHPKSDLQSAARAARYRLLESWCHEACCLHLLLAHHREDQAETFWLRLARGSGLDGLSAMPALAERPQCRLLRPLLGVAPARLRARLQAERQPWIEDRSNANLAFARVRVRRSSAVLAAEGLSAERLAQTIRQLGRARSALEQDVARLLAQVVWIEPMGIAVLDPGPLRAASAETALRALAAVLMTVSGSDYPARRDRLERLFEWLTSSPLGRGRTLGGCRIIPQRHKVLVCREFAAVEEERALSRGGDATWDGRFRIALNTNVGRALSVAALGTHRLSAADRRSLAPIAVPARAALPALWRGGRIKGLMHPTLARQGCMAHLQFRPARALSPVGFTVV